MGGRENPGRSEDISCFYDKVHKVSRKTFHILGFIHLYSLFLKEIKFEKQVI